MLKIVLYCDAKSRKLIEPELTDYMTKNNIGYEIYHVDGASKFLSNYFFEKDFQLLLIYKNNSLQYILKTYHNHDKNYMHTVSGTLKLPLIPIQLNYYQVLPYL